MIGRRRASPEIVTTSHVSDQPGGPEDLRRILLRWELALARKALALLQAEAKDSE